MRLVSNLTRLGALFTWLHLGKPFVFILSALLATLALPAFSQDTGVLVSGDWGTPSTWTSGTVPNSSNTNRVFIGSTYPNSPQAISNATVTLTQDESAANVLLGYSNGSPSLGTLNLGANHLTITNNLTVGCFPGGGGVGVITEIGGGSFTAGSILMFNSGNSLTMGAADVTSTIDIENDGILTTTVVGNITNGGAIANGATLNLGANLNVGAPGALNVESTGATTTLNMKGHNITAPLLDLGYDLTSAVTLDRGSGTQGTLTLEQSANRPRPESHPDRRGRHQRRRRHRRRRDRHLHGRDAHHRGDLERHHHRERGGRHAQSGG